MKQKLRRLLGGIILGVGALFLASEIWPQRTAKLMLWGLYKSARLERSYVEASFGRVHYLEGGTGQTVVLMHGIFALKEHWVDMSRQLADDYHVVILDLPGFGENSRLDPTAYAFAQQVENTREALDAIGIDSFHVVANSMGAHIAAQMAMSQPDRVKSISFVGSPVGVASPIESDMEQAIARGITPLVVTSEAEYDARMQWLFPVAPFLPRPIARTWSADEVSHAQLNRQIWEVVGGSMTPRLDKMAPMITQPSFIIWCDQDRIFHVSGARVLADILPNSTLTIATDCGHLPMLDRPAETGQALVGFLNSQAD
jgi:pimeloyl-ACP methyl ester carboxylesterase